jgi:hypothetical protein
MTKVFTNLSLLVYLAVPAFATSIVYDNGAPSLATSPMYSISGTVVGKTASVSDTFTLLNNGTKLNSVDVALWIPTAASLSALTYCVSGVDDCSSLVDETGTNVALSLINTIGTSGGFTLDEFSFALQGLNYQAGTYWLLLDNANVSTGIAYWDSDGGVGCTGDGNGGSPGNGCPSGAQWSLQELPIATQGSFTSNNSESFDVIGAPEPGSMALVGVGLLLLARKARKRRG